MGRLPEARCYQERSSQPTGTSGTGNLMSRCCPWLFVAICARCHPRGMQTVLESPLHGQSQGLLSCYCLSTDCTMMGSWAHLRSCQAPIAFQRSSLYSRTHAEREESRGCGRRQSIPPDPCASPAHRSRRAEGNPDQQGGRAMLTRQRVVSVLWCQAMKEAALARQ